MKPLLLFLASIALFSQGASDQAPRKPATFALASLPSATTWVGREVIATSVTAGSCTVAGASQTKCYAVGGAWVPIGGASGGITSITAGPTGGISIDSTNPLIPIIDLDTDVVPANIATKTINIEVFGPTTAAATGDGKAYFVVPPILDGMKITGVRASVISAGTTGTLDIQIARCATTATGNQCSGTVTDVLSTKLTLDSAENKSTTAATPAVINTSNNTLTVDQVIRIDIDAVHTTPSQGLQVILVCTLP